MGKKFYIGFTILFFLCVIGCGIVVYNNNTKIIEEQARFDQFEWVIPLSEEYLWINSDSLDSLYFVGVLEDGVGVILDQNGKVVERGGEPFANKHAYSYAKGDAVGLKNYKGNAIVSAQFEYINSYDGHYGVGGTFDGKYKIFNRYGKILMTAEYTYQVNGRYFFVEQNVDSDFIYDVRTGRQVKNIDGDPVVTYLGKGYYEADMDVTGEDPRIVYFDKNFNEVDLPKGIKKETQSDIVYKDGKYRYIDKQGKAVFQLHFKGASDGSFIREANFYNGLAVIGNYGQEGLVDKKGKWILPPEYDLCFLSRNLIAVGRGNQWGVMKVSEGNYDY